MASLITAFELQPKPLRRNTCLPMVMATENQGFGEPLVRQFFAPSRTQPQAKAAPLYITIGPPCAGKTEALRVRLEQDGYDPEKVLSSQEVALDEQSEVYQRVPLAAFLFPTTRLDPKLGDTILRSGATVRDRLLDPSPPPLDKTDMELRNIILRVAGRMTPQDYADKTREEALQAGDTVQFFRNRRIEIAEDLIQAVEQVSVQAVGEVLFQMQLQQDAEEENELPYEEEEEPPKLELSTVNATSAHLLSAKALIQTPFVNLFVPHAIFNGGLDKAEEKLQHLLDNLPANHPVSWGNTNTRPVEYVAALKAAQRAGRPVQFVAWGKNMPRVSRQELLRRTVSKFRATGRYIPAGAVGAALGRVERLIQEAEKEVAKLVINDSDEEVQTASEQDANHNLNIALTALAGFAMDKEGYVIKVGEPRNFNKKKNKQRNGRKRS